jgi:hypothetical protein
MQKFMIFFMILLIFSCTTNKKFVQETVKQVEKEAPDDIKNVYYRLIQGIKARDMEKIASCYSKDCIYEYGNNTKKKFVCFDGNKSISGLENVMLQYKYLFKNRILDNIEFEIEYIDNKDNIPELAFINAWQHSDDNHMEILEFVKIDEKYFISKHIIKKKNDME